MSSLELFAVVAFCLVLAFFVYNVLGPIKREKRKAYRYRLFAVRDRLVQLVAEGKLREEDELFQYFYHLVNSLIPHAKPLTLGFFVTAMRSSDLTRDGRAEELIRKLPEYDPEVREVIEQFFRALLTILFDASLSVQLLLIVMVKVPRVWMLLATTALPGSFFRLRTEAAMIYGKIDSSLLSRV